MGLALVALSRRRVLGSATTMRLPYEHFSFSRSEPCPAAHDEPLPAAVAFYVRGEATRRLAEVLRSRRAERGGGLTSEGQRPERAEVLFFPAMRGFDVHDVQEPPADQEGEQGVDEGVG